MRIPTKFSCSWTSHISLNFPRITKEGFSTHSDMAITGIWWWLVMKRAHTKRTCVRKEGECESHEQKEKEGSYTVQWTCCAELMRVHRLREGLLVLVNVCTPSHNNGGRLCMQIIGWRHCCLSSRIRLGFFFWIACWSDIDASAFNMRFPLQLQCDLSGLRKW